jgi:hypothetical protein
VFGEFVTKSATGLGNSGVPGPASASFKSHPEVILRIAKTIKGRAYQTEAVTCTRAAEDTPERTGVQKTQSSNFMLYIEVNQAACTAMSPAK